MLYRLCPTPEPVALEEVSPDLLVAGIIGSEELNEYAERFGLSEAAVNECLSDHNNYRNTLDVYEDHSFGIINVVNARSVFDSSDRVAFFLKRNLFLLCVLRDLDGSVTDIFNAALRRYKPEAVSLEKLLYATLEATIAADAPALADMEFSISAMEGEVIAKEVSEDFDTQVYQKKRELLILRNYYEQLIDLGEALQENENDLFDGEYLHYVELFTSKAERLSQNVQMLRDSLTQLRDAHQSLLDYQLNRIMKVFTVVTVIFLPLTLLVGWYGMNFTHMPELDAPYAYPAVIGVAVLLVAVTLLIFKRKKLL